MLDDYRNTECPEAGRVSRSAQAMRLLRDPVPAQSLACFRMAFGLMMAFWAIDYIARDRVRFHCSVPLFHFTWYGFDWVRPWPGDGMSWQFAGLVIAGLMLCVGAFCRLSALVFAVGFTHFFLIDRTHYQNHYYLILLLSWLMVMLPTGRLWSVDAASGRIRGSRVIPRWSLLLLQFHIALPYVYGGLAKLDADWLSGQPMRCMLMTKAWVPVAGPYLDTNTCALFLTYGGLFFDLLVVPSLIWRPTRAAAFSLAVIFHLANAFLFSIHVFPWLMIAATTVFFEPDWPGRLVRQSPVRRVPGAQQPVSGPLSRQAAMLAGIGVLYCAFHLLWPLRHHVLPGNAGWTEDGHYFSWRMMLRGKTSGFRYFVTNPRTGQTHTPDVARYLNEEQLGKFARDPEMILHLAHFLAEVESHAAGEPLQIHAIVLTSLNGRRPQLLIDPRLDLAQLPRHSAVRDWILPLTEPLPQTPWTAPVSTWQYLVPLPELSYLQRRPVADSPERASGSHSVAGNSVNSSLDSM